MHRPVPFGKYILLERISVGGMAEVFKGKAFGVEGFARPVAIKRILPHLAEDPRFVEMFINEAKVAVQLSHANIAQVYELGRCDDDHYIAMEYIAGKDCLSLAQYVKRTGDRLPFHLAAYIGSRVAEGLGYAHRKLGPDGRPLGIIHRDISPQNVLIAYEGAVKLIDFGIAKAAIHSSHQTQAGVLKGKFGYMSPEQIAGKPLDQRSDIFALGTVLHEMLSGERLFAGDNDFLTLEKVRAAKADPPSHKNPDVPPQLDNIVLRALAREPGERYQSAAQLADDLGRFLHMSGAGLSSKALKGWMRTRFAGDIAEEEAKDEHFGRLVLTADGDLLEEQQAEEDATALWDPLSEDMLPEGMHFEQPEEKPRIVSIARRPFPGQVAAAAEDESMTIPSPVSGSLTGHQDTDGITVPTPLRHQTAPSDVASVPHIVPHSAPPPRRRSSSGAPIQSAPTPMPAYDDPTEWARPPSHAPTTNQIIGRSSGRRDFLRVGLTLLVAGAGGIGVYQLIARTGGATGTARVTIDVQPPDALRVTLDGKPLDTTHSPIVLGPLAAGRYTLVVERDGYASQTRTLDVGDGDDSQIGIVLDRENNAPGRLRVETVPSGDKTSVQVGGRALDPAAREAGVEIASGEAVEITVERTGYRTQSQTVTLAADEERTVRLTLEPTPASIMIDSNPPGQVFVDDKSHRRTPVTISDLDPTRPHRIRIEARNHRVWEKTVTFEDDTRFRRLDVDLDRK